jgi:hypothetical protein
VNTWSPESPSIDIWRTGEILLVGRRLPSQYITSGTGDLLHITGRKCCASLLGAVVATSFRSGPGKRTRIWPASRMRPARPRLNAVRTVGVPGPCVGRVLRGVSSVSVTAPTPQHSDHLFPCVRRYQHFRLRLGSIPACTRSPLHPNLGLPIRDVEWAASGCTGNNRLIRATGGGWDARMRCRCREDLEYIRLMQFRLHPVFFFSSPHSYLLELIVCTPFKWHLHLSLRNVLLS